MTDGRTRTLRGVKTRLATARVASGDVGLFPVFMLTGMFFVDQLDTVAFGVLAPEIKANFHLSNAGFGLIVAVNFLALIVLGLVAGWLGDRVNRVLLVRLSLIVAGAGSVLTGLAPVVAALVVFRIVNGAGLVVTGPVHNALIADYYPPERRAMLFGLHSAGDYGAALIGPVLAAGLALVFGWRGPFVLFAIPIAVLLVLSLRLNEPRRGGTDNAIAAEAAAGEPPLRLARASRILSQVPTFRRTWLALAFLGAGFVPVAAFLPIYFDSVFGVGILGRGVLGAATAAASLLGLIVGSRFTRQSIRQSPNRVQMASGAVFVVMAAELAALATAATLAAAIVAALAIGFTAGLFQPMTTSVQALVCPPRARGVGFAYGGLFLAAGVVLAPLTGGIADRDGLRVGILAFAPLVAIGGVLLASAGRFVIEDAARAVASLEATATLAEARRSIGDKSLLVCRGLDVAYDGVQVLFGVDLEVVEGTVLALLGTNGAGKSTLLKAIVGLVQPSAGMVFYDGQDFGGVGAQEAARRGVTLMPGGKAVFPTMTVDENLRIAAWQHRADDRFVQERTSEVLAIFPALQQRRGQEAGNLSGGEQQMLALAQTLISKPRLLMIDELTLGLAPTVVQQLFPIIERIRASGVTIILVEQSVNLALALADEAVFMEKGEIRFRGATADLLKRRDLLRSVFLEGAAKAMAGTS